jgi:cell division septal protein FtsQ
LTEHLERRKDWIKGRREKRKLARHARVRRQILRYALLAGLVALGVSGFTALQWRLQDAPNNIEVRGNQVVTDEQVKHALQAAEGKQLYKLDPKALEKNVCALPAVRYAFVRRYLAPKPHLVVDVLEEFPWASLSATPDGPVDAVISQTGRVIPVNEFPSVVQPALKITAAPGLKMTGKDVAQWDGWVNLLATQTGQNVETIDLRQPASIKVKVGDLNLHIGAADSTLNRRIGRLASVVPVLASLKNRVEYIDLSLDSNIPLKIDKHIVQQQPQQATATPQI